MGMSSYMFSSVNNLEVKHRLSCYQKQWKSLALPLYKVLTFPKMLHKYLLWENFPNKINPDECITQTNKSQSSILDAVVDVWCSQCKIWSMSTWSHCLLLTGHTVWFLMMAYFINSPQKSGVKETNVFVGSVLMKRYQNKMARLTYIKCPLVVLRKLTNEVLIRL